MAAPITQHEIELYGNVLSEIRYRIEHAVMKLTQVTEVVEFESAALQLRKSIELVALGTLAANRHLAVQVSTTLHKKDWHEARKLLRNINPSYWPTPFKDGIGQDGRRSLQPYDEPFLSEDEAGGAWGFLSDLLHADNPFARIEITQQRVDKAREISAKLRGLLGLHTAELGNRENVLLAEMDTPPDGHVSVIVLNEVSRETRLVEG